MSSKMYKFELNEAFQEKASILEKELCNFSNYLLKADFNVFELKLRMKAAEQTWEDYRKHILDGTRLPVICLSYPLSQDLIENANKYFKAMGRAQAMIENLNGPKPQSNTDTA